MNIVKTVILTLLAGCIGFIVYQAILSRRETEADTTTAQFRDIEKTLTIPGIIHPLKEIEIKSSISGVLAELLVQIGDEVTAGQPLAKVQFVKDPLEYKRLLKDVEVAKTRWLNEKGNFERTEELYGKHVVSPEEYENVRSSMAVIRAEYQALLAELDMTKGIYTQQGISNTITATGNGTILELPVKEGGSVMARGTLNEGTAIARLADLKSLVFKGNVLESDVIRLRKGMEMTFSIGPSDEIILKGAIGLIAPKGFVQDGVARFEVTAGLVIPDSCRELVKAGCTANATVVLEKKTHVLSLDEKEFLFSNDSIYVEVKNEKGGFRKQRVETGISDGIYTEIVAGIDSTARIKTTTRP